MAKVVTVSELTKYLATCFKADPVLKGLMVQGEVSNFKRYSSGHCYFNLKDKGAIIPCVMFKSSAFRLKFQPEDGMQVIAGGYVQVYEEGGKYQLYVSSMTPDGIGDLAMAYQQLKERLAEEGLFNQEHKKPLPLYPKTIGIVTSPTGAVLRDINRVSKLRFPAIKLVLKPVQVQGEGSAQQIADAIDFFNEKYPVDVLIVGRGGGSIEDLWSFNEEVVVRAIYRSQIPVISAVGHETDTTLADYVADKRAATPSQAAEFAVRDVKELKNHIKNLQLRMASALQGSLRERFLALKALQNSMALKNPQHLLESRYQKLDRLQERLDKAAENCLDKKKQQLVKITDKLELMNPLTVLKRGFGLPQKEDGSVIRSTKDIKIEDMVTVQLDEGKFTAQVTAIEEV